MNEPATSSVGRLLDLEQLREWISQQRWYASKSRAIAGLEIVECLPLRDDPPLVMALVQTRFATGTHELYQLLIGTDTFDALGEARQGLELLRRIDAGEEIATSEGRFSFQRVDGAAALGEDVQVRLMGVEQSNSSMVFDDRLV